MSVGPPAVAVRVSLRHPDGDVVERVRLCWRVPPSAGEVLRAVTTRSLAARRRGLRLEIDDAPVEVWDLFVAVGLVDAVS